MNVKRYILVGLSCTSAESRVLIVLCCVVLCCVASAMFVVWCGVLWCVALCYVCGVV